MWMSEREIAINQLQLWGELRSKRIDLYEEEADTDEKLLESEPESYE